MGFAAAKSRDGTTIEVLVVLSIGEATLAVDRAGDWWSCGGTASTRIKDHPIAGLVFLEQPLETIETAIAAAAARHPEIKFDAMLFDLIIRFALRGPSVYWVTRALTWLEAQPGDFASELAAVQSARWAGQKLRHAAARILRRRVRNDEDVRCADCGAVCESHIGQHISARNTLEWSRSMRCRACGAAIEEDAAGLPPAWAQKVLTERSGVWVLSLVNESERRRSVAVVRALLGLDLKAAAQMLKAQKAPVWSGTEVECLWVKQCLEQAGIVANVGLVSPPSVQGA